MIYCSSMADRNRELLRELLHNLRSQEANLSKQAIISYLERFLRNRLTLMEECQNAEGQIQIKPSKLAGLLLLNSLQAINIPKQRKRTIALIDSYDELDIRPTKKQASAPL